MNRRVTLGILAIVLGAFLTPAAPAVGQTSGKDATQKVGEAADAIKGYTVDKKNEAVVYAKKLVSDLDAKIKDLDAQVARDTSAAKADAQRQLPAIHQQLVIVKAILFVPETGTTGDSQEAIFPPAIDTAAGVIVWEVVPARPVL